MARWRREASREIFVEEFKGLEKARNELSDMPNERQRRLVVLDAEREAQQRQRYLDRFHIDRAKIKGIGAGRTAMLASYGIETAADIDSRKIYQIPGFGQTLTSDLLQWRRGHEQNFRFNPNESVDPRDISSMDSELGARKQSLVVALTQGPSTLQRLNKEICPCSKERGQSLRSPKPI
jgi:DNA-binding helix-hairpin-helix protein with protein kinase domain